MTNTFEVIFHTLFHGLKHTFFHTWYMLFVLFIVYLVIELVEHKAKFRIHNLLSNNRFGILGASLLGLFPQCSFGVVCANLFSERIITIGALIAVFIATSDDAIPILAAKPSFIIPVLLIKFIFAVAAGFLIDNIFKLFKVNFKKNVNHHLSNEHFHEGGEHHHCSHCDSGKGILTSAIKRTLSVFIFVFLTSFVLELLFDFIGESRIKALLMTDSIFQPFLSALIGLIPSCAVSVIVTELFIEGTLAFGSLIAALSAGAGIGLIVLFRTNKNLKENFLILSLLYVISALIGVIINLAMLVIK